MRLLEAGVFNTEALKYSVRRLESARLLQAARRATAIDGREDAGRRQQGRRHAEVRRAEPQPADVRRRRVAVRGLLRAAVVPDVELPGPRRDVHDLGAAGQPRARTTRSRSPSRSCSTGRSPPASTSSTARSGTSASSRRRRPAATSSTASRSADFSRMFVNYSYETVKVKDLNPPSSDPRDRAEQPVPAPTRCCSAQGGRRTISKIGPSFVYNTVDKPIFPTTGTRLHRCRSTSPASAATPSS